MIKIDNALLQEIGLGSLPQHEKDSLLKHIYETLEMRVGMRLADQMTNQQLDEFERYFEAKDDAGAFKWLETNFPNYKDVVQEEFDKLKLEVRQAAPQILGTAANQQGQGQLPPMQQSPAPNGQYQPSPYAAAQAPNPMVPPAQPAQPPMPQQPGQPGGFGDPNGMPPAQPGQPAGPPPAQPFQPSPPQPPFQQPAYDAPSGPQPFAPPQGQPGQPQNPPVPQPHNQPQPPQPANPFTPPAQPPQPPAPGQDNGQGQPPFGPSPQQSADPFGPPQGPGFPNQQPPAGPGNSQN